MSTGYFFKEGISGLKRARLATLTSVTSLTIAILLVGLLVRIGFNAYFLAEQLREMVSVEVFLNDISDEETNQLKSSIQEKGVIKSISYISKEDAKKEFLKSFGDQGNALASLNFLPASLELTFKSETTIEDIEQLIKDIETWAEIDEVRFDAALLATVEKRIQIFGLIGIGISIFVILTALLLVYNTIRLTIYSKQTIIRAMKLVGATKSFIRRPFLIEGFLQGFVASLFSSVLIIGIFQFLLPKVISQVGILAWPFGRWYYLIGFLIVLGCFLGLWGSQIATRKFINAVKITS